MKTGAARRCVRPAATVWTLRSEFEVSLPGLAMTINAIEHPHRDIGRMRPRRRDKLLE